MTSLICTMVTLSFSTSMPTAALPRYGSLYPYALGLKIKGYIVSQPDYAADFHTYRRLDLIPCDSRPLGHLHYSCIHMEIAQRFFQLTGLFRLKGCCWTWRPRPVYPAGSQGVFLIFLELFLYLSQQKKHGLPGLFVGHFLFFCRCFIRCHSHTRTCRHRIITGQSKSGNGAL